MRKNRFVKAILSILLAIVLTLQLLPQQTTSNITSYAATTSEVSLASTSAKNGIILQMHMWSFNNIKSKLPDIAAAGYKTIQVSPIQGAKNGSEWWNLYQPINQSIGNVLGTRDEFKSLCSEAEKYGIDVIVDVIMNHMANLSGSATDTWSDQVADEFKRSDFYHNQGQCSNWSSRWAVTQQGIGMPDLNTQNTEVQAKAIAFLNDCIACGADGFRFDAAKHIETNVGVDSGQSFAGNYWTNVLGSLTNRSKLFIYGEVLDELNSDSDNISGYASFMSVTDHYYASTLRNAVRSWNLSSAQNWAVTLPTGTRVSYVENHDNFEHSESNISDDQRKIAWGILAARNDVTPMYLSRRTGSVGSIGTTDFANTEVAAVNWFHNAMAGQNEYLRYANNNNCMLVDRGTIGTAIINEGSSFYLDSATNLQSGTYTDRGGSGATFTVANGKITGTVPANRIVVLHNFTINYDSDDDGDDTTTSMVAYFDNSSTNWSSVNIYVYDDSGSTVKQLTAWPGAAMTKDSTGLYKYELSSSWTSGKTKVIFNNGGSSQVPAANQAGYVISGTMIYQNGTWATYTPGDDGGDDTTTSMVTYFDNSSTNWSSVNIYVYDDSGSTVKKLAAWPGVAMTKDSTGLYKYELSSDWTSGKTKVIFNNGGSSQIPAANQAGYVVSGTMIYQNGTWSTYTPSQEESVVAYFDNSSNNWSAVKIYVYDESSTTVKKVAAWPGVAMTKGTNDIYSYTVPDGWSTTSTRVIFNNGSGTQIPAASQQGYLLSTSMIYSNGTWSEY